MEPMAFSILCSRWPKWPFTCIESVILLSYTTPPVRAEGTHCLHWLMQNFHCPLVPVKLFILTLAQHLLDLSGLYGCGWNALAPTRQSLCSCLRHLLRFPVYYLEVAFVTGVCCCQHHFNVSVTQIFWRLKSSFFSCTVLMDFMLDWSRLQVSTLYARSQFTPGIIAVAE